MRRMDTVAAMQRRETALPEGYQGLGATLLQQARDRQHATNQREWHSKCHLQTKQRLGSTAAGHFKVRKHETARGSQVTSGTQEFNTSICN